MTNAELTDWIIQYETEGLDEEDTIALFQELIDTGQAWLLQGSYGRTAHELIQGGHCTLGEVRRSNAYGGYVPSRDEVKPGSPGSPEFVAARWVQS